MITHFAQTFLQPRDVSISNFEIKIELLIRKFTEESFNISTHEVNIHMHMAYLDNKATSNKCLMKEWIQSIISKIKHHSKSSFQRFWSIEIFQGT